MASYLKTDFDPYYEWLGIPPAEQPPNLYRLLGLQKFESDPAVIENAADRQMLYLRQLQTSPRWPYAEAILNTVARTRLELLDPQRRLAYDQFLMQSDQQAQAPRPVSVTIPVACTSAVQPAHYIEAQPVAAAVETPMFQSASSDPHVWIPRRKPAKPASRNHVIRIAGVILGGPVGILIGLWLAKALLGVDLIGSLTQPKESSTKVEGKAQPVRIAPPKELPRPIQRPASTSPGAEREAAPEIYVEPEPVRAVLPAQLQTKPVVPQADILTSLPLRVELPRTDNPGPVTLLTVAGDSSALSWDLKSDAADLPTGGSIFCRPAGADRRAWNIQFAPDAARLDAGAIPVARLQAQAGGVQFQWTTATGDESLRRQLANCLLVAQSGMQSRSIQLRHIQTAMPLRIDLGKKDTTLEFELAEPPRADKLLLELTAAPPGSAWEGGVSTAGVNKPVVMQFAELPGAELSLRLQRKAGAGQFAVRATPEFMEGARIRYELTRPKLGEMTKRWTETGQKAALNIKQSQARVKALESQLEDLNGVSGDISVMTERTRQMKAVRERIRHEVERLPTYRKRLLESEARLKAVPTVEKFLSARDQLAVPFRIIAQCGDERIVLAESR